MISVSATAGNWGRKRLGATWALTLGLLAPVSAAAAIAKPLLAIGLLGGFVVLYIAFTKPDQSLQLWLVVVCFTPVWLGATFPGVGYVQPAALVAIPVLLGVVARRATWAPSKPDLVIILYVALAFFATRFGSTQTELKGVLLSTIVGYSVGRCISGAKSSDEMGRILARLTVLFALLAVLESLTRWHPFRHLAVSSPLGFWADVQSRAGLDRSEVTFGHALALGAFLALGLPFVLKYQKRPYLSAAITLAGVFSTVSRGPIISAALVWLLSLAPGKGLSRMAARKVSAVTLLVLLGAVAYPLAQPILTHASVDLSQSSQYRSALVPLIASARPLGLAHGAQFDTSSKTFIFGGAYGSIDNAPLLLALTEGLLPTIVLLGGLFAFVLAYGRGRAGPATIGIVGQIPALLTVALITQWAVLLFFVAGMAGTELSRRNTPAREESARVGLNIPVEPVFLSG